MSVYVGIDVHRKRSQVAVIDAKGEVLANRNVPNGAEPILKVIGGLPPGTPAAFEAAYGTSWPVELLEDYLGLIDALQGRIDRLDWEIRQRARPGPAGQ